MAIDLLKQMSLNDRNDQMVTDMNIRTTTSSNLLMNTTTNDLIELIKSTTLNGSKSLSNNNNNHRKSLPLNGLKNPSRFSLISTEIDFHPFALRRIWRSLSSNNFYNKNNVKLSSYSKKSQLDSIQEHFLEIQENSELSVSATIIKSKDNDKSLDSIMNTKKNDLTFVDQSSEPQPSLMPNCDKNVSDQTHHLEHTNGTIINNYISSTSSSTETIKVEDRYQSNSLETSPKKTIEQKIRENSSSANKNENENILETLRQVVRMCTKMDMSKRASAIEVHEMLEAKLINLEQSTTNVWIRERGQQQQRNRGTATKDDEEKDSKD